MTERLTRERDLDACRAITARASKSFYLSSWLLPADVRRDAWTLYAFCRVADDAVDLADPSDGLVSPKMASEDAAAVRLCGLRGRLDAVYRDRPSEQPVDRAFARLVARTGLPRVLPDALLDGMEEDLGQREVQDEAELERYAVRVAGAVGLMMTHLMGVRDRVVLARALDLGVAMQLTNIARDVGEDAARGRVYLPATWLRDEGLRPQDVLAARRATPELRRVVARTLDEADVLYRRADTGVPGLPGACRFAIASARRIYSAIGDELRRTHYESVSKRVHVSRRRKVLLLGRALAASHQRLPLALDPPLAAGLPLIDALVGAKAS